MKSKGLKRLLFFVIFMIPVLWYLILQLFGDNSFSLADLGSIDNSCATPFSGITVISKTDSLSVAKTNYLNRVTYGVDKRKASFEKREQEFFDCINQSGSDLVLVRDSVLWGTYSLTRDGVDELLTELDILSIQESYGKGTSR